MNQETFSIQEITSDRHSLGSPICCIVFVLNYYMRIWVMVHTEKSFFLNLVKLKNNLIDITLFRLFPLGTKSNGKW